MKHQEMDYRKSKSMNSVNGFNSVLDKAKYKDITLKYSSIEIIQSTKLGEKKYRERDVGHSQREYLWN